MSTSIDVSRFGLNNTQDRFAPTRSQSSRRVCVYCGSSRGSDPAYAEAARQLGAALANADFELVYGGGTDGLMGVVARSVLAHGGRVTGIIPAFLTFQCRAALSGDHHLIVVEHMHARKQAMFDKADAFVALPGGVGTLEELVEQMTWLKLGRHTKPIIIADIQGFWGPLVDLLKHMSACGFIEADRQAPYQVSHSVEGIIATLHAQVRVPTDDGVSWRHDTRIATTVLVEDATLVGRPRSLSPHDIYENE